MSDIKNDNGAEPDATATTTPNAQSTNTNGADPVAENTESAKVETAEQTNNGARSTESPSKSRGDSHHHHQNNRRRGNMSKYDPSVRGVSSDAAEIRKLAEFYFGDANLPTDNYLWQLTDGPANLPVQISKIHSFRRMRQYQPYSAVVAALRESKFLEVTGPEGMEEIKRKTPYDPDRKDNRMPRSIYAKGFGEETPTSQFDIEAFFAEHGPTNVVRLRRTEDTKLFKGSVFVEFADEETATKFLALDPKPMWQGKHELQIMSKQEYVTTKKNAILDGTLIPNTTRSTSHRGRGGRNFDRRGDRDPDDWKKRREDDQKSGFRDNKRGRGHRGHGSRGGQGRGRGDRRNDDRNRERNGEDRAKSQEASTERTEDGAKNAGESEAPVPSKKHAREDDGAADEVPAKRVDQKEVSTDAA